MGGLVGMESGLIPHPRPCPFSSGDLLLTLYVDRESIGKGARFEWGFEAWADLG